MDGRNPDTLNDLQLFDLYRSIELRPAGTARWSRLYPKFVQITGRAFCAPHPHRHYGLEDFLGALYGQDGDELRNLLLSGQYYDSFTEPSYNFENFKRIFEHGEN